MLESVVSAAQMRQVGDCCRPVVFSRDRVVDVAAAGGLAASRKAAVLVASPQDASLLVAWTVAVDGEHVAVNRVEEQAVPPAGRAGEPPSGLGIHWPVPDEFCRRVSAQHGGGGDRDLHVRANRVLLRHGVRDVVGGRGAGEKNVCEHVGSHFTERARVCLRRVAGVVIYRVGRVVRCLAEHCVASVARSAGIDDRSRKLRDAVEHAVRNFGGQRCTEIGHAIVAIGDPHSTPKARSLVTLRQWSRLHPLGERTGGRAKPPRSLAFCNLECGALVGSASVVIVDRQTRIRDDARVREVDVARCQGRVRCRKPAHEYVGVAHARLHRAIGYANRGGEFGCE